MLPALPYALEDTHFSKLEEVSTPRESYTCMGIITNLHMLKFTRTKALQVVLADETTCEFLIMYWGNYESLRSKLRCGMIILLENFEVDYRDPQRRAGRCTDHTMTHLLTNNFENDHLCMNKAIFPKLSQAVMVLAEWARKSTHIISAIPTSCYSLHDTYNKTFFNLNLTLSHQEIMKEKREIECLDAEGEKVLLKLTLTQLLSVRGQIITEVIIIIHQFYNHALTYCLK